MSGRRSMLDRVTASKTPGRSNHLVWHDATRLEESRKMMNLPARHRPDVGERDMLLVRAEYLAGQDRCVARLALRRRSRQLCKLEQALQSPLRIVDPHHPRLPRPRYSAHG